MAESSVVDYEWSCPSCTFINKPGSFKCFVCGTPKGTATRQVRCHTSTVEQQYMAESLQSIRLHNSRSTSRILASNFNGSDVITNSGKRRLRSRNASNSSIVDVPAISQNSNSTYKWPKLNNIDRSSKRSCKITVDNISVIITEFDSLYSYS